MGSVEEERSLLEQGLTQNKSSGLYTGDGSVDINGKPVLKRNTGNWRAGTKCCECLAYSEIAYNLVSYLTKKLHQGNVSAARNVTTWQGTCYLTPLIGATLADSYWGRYWTVAAFSTIYVIGMCMLTLSASVPSFRPAECVGSTCSSATPIQYAVFFFGLYLIALGAGGIKPCVSAFGADQFDDIDPEERVKRGSFFNWLYFSTNIGALISGSFLVWIQENAGWGIGFGIPTLFMVIAIACFFLGTPLYRFQKPGGSPFTRMCQVLVAAFRKWNLDVPPDSNLLYETQTSAIKGCRKIEHSDELKCRDEKWRFLQSLDSLHCNAGGGIKNSDIISVIFCIPIYDGVIVPIARKFTGKERGFSELQRMGIGLFISFLGISAAALVEINRLQLAGELGLVDEDVSVPLSILWQVPQFFLIGAAEVFTAIGQLEFFYNQSPDAMRSLCSALQLVTSSLGSYLSSFILTMVTYFTSRGGKTGWIPENLNEGHLDYFFWLLSGLSIFNMLVYIVCAKNYKQKQAS